MSSCVSMCYVFYVMRVLNCVLLYCVVLCYIMLCCALMCRLQLIGHTRGKEIFRKGSAPRYKKFLPDVELFTTNPKAGDRRATTRSIYPIVKYL